MPLRPREKYLRMDRYVNAIVAAIKARCDPANWSEADKAKLQQLSDSGDQLLATIAEEIDGDPDGFYDEPFSQAEDDIDPEAIAAHIKYSLLESFTEGRGVYREAETVPYFSVRDLLTGGLAALDPEGGSDSYRHWWSGVSELFEMHFEGMLAIDSDEGW